MFTYPVERSAYRLTAGSSFYPTRRNGDVLGIVLHVTAGLQDTDMAGPDNSAEGTAKWAVNSGAQVSWHVGVDSDSIVPCLPVDCTAWHAKGYNSRTFGIEISNADAKWGNKPANWVDATLRNAARAVAPIVKAHGLPLVKASRGDVDKALAAGRPFGFTYHSNLSDIRVDPGADFPWAKFIALVKNELTSPEEDDHMPTAQEIADAVWAKQLAKPGNDKTESAGSQLGKAHIFAYRTLNAADPAKVAAAVVAALPSDATVDVDALARAIVLELGKDPA